MIWSTPKAYVSVMLGILGLFGVYGIVDNILLQRNREKFPKEGDWPFNQRLTVYFSMAVNFSYILAAAIGVIAVKWRKLFLFNWSAFVLFVSFAVQLIHGVACVRAGMKSMTGNIFSTFRQYQANSKYLEWLVDFQWQYDCCGIKSYMDWRIFAFKMSSYDVPESCCLRNDVAPALSCGRGLTAPNVTVDYAAGLIYTVGCGEIISKSYQEEIQMLGFTMIALAFLGLAAGLVIFVCQHKAVFLVAQRRFRMHDQDYQHKATEIGASPKRRSSQSHEDCASETSNASLEGTHARAVSSYYRSLGVQRTGGRGKGVRQDSVRNFQNRTWIPRYIPRTRACQRQKVSLGGQAKGYGGKYSRGAHKEMRTKLEMLMHPIETQSTNSAVPNPSSLFPFRIATPKSSSVFLSSKKDGEGGGGWGSGKNGEIRLLHYNSLPQVKTFPPTTTSYHYKASHLHAHVKKGKFPLHVKSGHGGGKFPSVMMVTNFPPIQEENESVTSGNSHASTTGSPSASSSPKSLSKSSSKYLEAEQVDPGWRSNSKIGSKKFVSELALTQLSIGTENDSTTESRHVNNNLMHGVIQTL